LLYPARVGEVAARAGREVVRLWIHPAESAGEPELRAALAELEASGRVAWRGAATASDLREVLEAERADALVLDVSAAGHGALDVLRERRAHGDTSRVLLIADFGDAEAASRARALGGCTLLATESARSGLLAPALRELVGLSVEPAPPARSAGFAPALLWRSDARGSLTHATRRLVEFVGRDEDVLGRGLFERVHPDDRGAWLAAFSELAAPAAFVLDLRLCAHDGAYRSVRLEARPAFAADGTVDAFVGSLHDVDDLVRSRDAAREELARHEAASRELEELAFAGAHDLQEPLRSLERELAGAQRGEPADLALALRQVSRMRTLLRDLVDYAGATQVRVSSERSDLGQALEWALDNLRPALVEANAEVKVETLAHVLADPIQLARVFQNLLANALRFRSAASPVITVGSVPRDAHLLVFVRDNGRGIPPAHHEAVFRVFERAHADVREGSGMGLAICRRIVERHGGRIWVESEPGLGSSFYFTLRRALD
jgi:PAS domain S-box-containing protein